MAADICPFAELRPGASWSQNGSRRIGVRAVTVHTTQGTNSLGLGINRQHSTPGTFNFLTGRNGELWQFYPVNVRCSHAAGGNYAGPGIENEGFTGQDFPAAQLATLGRLARWLNSEWGVPLGLYDSSRIWVDQTNYAGFINHGSITYPPNPSYNHYDRLTAEQWQQAIGSSGGNQTGPQYGSGVRNMFIAINVEGANIRNCVVDGGYKALELGGVHKAYGILEGSMAFIEKGVPATVLSKAQYDALPKPFTGSGGGPGVDLTPIKAGISAVAKETTELVNSVNGLVSSVPA